MFRSFLIKSLSVTIPETLPLLFKIKRNNEILEYSIVPEIKSIKTFIGSKKNINYIGINPLINPIVGKVLPDSPARFAGLKNNDKILKINNEKVQDARQIIEIVKTNENKVLKLKMDLSQGSGMVIWLGTLFLAGFTPLPYKVFTITSGLIAFDIIAFIIISFISRGLRFYLVSILTAKFGEKFVKLIEQKGAVWSSIIGIIIIGILAIFYFTFIK